MLLALLVAHPTWAADETQFNSRVLPLVQKFCIDCHSGSEAEAGLSFDAVNRGSHVDDHPDLWEDIAGKLRRREMPPKDSPQPSAEESDAVATWISAQLQRLAEAQKPNPGRVTMRRLNRVEYNNTIHELTGMDFQPADDFPADDTGYGFDNIADVLALPPLLMEKYLAAAEQILDRAIVEQTAGKPILELKGSSFRGDGERDGELARLNTAGVLEAELEIPQSGAYQIIVRAFGEQAGVDPVRVSVRVDGNEVRMIDVPAKRDDIGEYVVPWKLESGEHRIGLAFVNDYYNPDAADPTMRDRNLLVEKLSIRPNGPREWDSLPASHRRIILGPPTPENRRDLARETIHRFAHKAYRRTVSGEEVSRLYRLFQNAERDGASFEQAMKVALTAVLVSPHFLYRIEVDRPGEGHEGTRKLREFELVNRLSYFIWSSMPDNELFDAARRRALKQPEQLRKQVERMLNDPRSSALVESFAVQWLQLRKLGMTSPDPELFSGCTPELLADMRRETELFFAAVLRENRPLTDLIDADFTFVNERLAKHYGMDGVHGNEFRRVSVSRERRGGILTHASVLALTSNPTRTSPVKRGKWVLDNLLGEPPPPPPPGVPEFPETGGAKLTGTLRQRFEQHRAPNACGSCHSRIDPLGFGLENYDAVGRWRTHDGESPVDASGVLPDGRSFRGPAELKQLLASRKDDIARAFAEKLLTYALGRGITRSDRRAVDTIVAQAKQDEYKIRSFVFAVVASDPFTKRSTEEQ
jgi:hypothetical protein